MARYQVFDPIETPLAGANLIEASARHGEDLHHHRAFPSAVLEKNLTVREILVVTFTEAATEELKDKIRKKIREALRPFNRESEIPFWTGCEGAGSVTKG